MFDLVKEYARKGEKSEKAAEKGATEKSVRLRKIRERGRRVRRLGD